MRAYERGDMVTMYVIIHHVDKQGSIIKAWTDDKDLAKIYMEFHQCKDFKLKRITRPIDQLMELINENNHDEISIINLTTRIRNKQKTISVPLTDTERMFIQEEINTFFSSMINYSYLYETIPYLKNKYQRALQQLFLNDILKHVIANKPSAIAKHLEMDELKVLYRSFENSFG